MLCTAACVNAIVMNTRQRQRVHKARPAPSNADDAAVFDAKLRRDLASYEAARVISRLEQGDSARRAPLISAQKNALLQRAPSAILAICGVEQLVARRAHNPEVAGSSPVPATSRVVANSSPRQTHERRVLLMTITRARLSLCTHGFRGDVNAWTTAVRVSASRGLHPRVAQLRPLADQSRPVSLRVSRCVGARLRQVSPLPQFPHPPTHHGGGITRCGGLHRRDPEYSEVLIGRLNPVSIRLGVDSYAHMAPAAGLA